MPPQNPHSKPQVEIPFIHLLRAIAVSMVLYDHLIGAYLETWAKMDWNPKIWLDTYILAPFGIIQSFGFMGVSLFFLVSGYIITHTASSENRREFFLKRFLRIYPALAVSVLVCILCGKWIGLPTPTLNDTLLNFTLLNYYSSPQVVIQGVAWSLAIEVIFYILTLFLLGTLKRSATLHLILQSCLIGLCIHSCRSFGANFFLFCASFSYVPYLLIGQLIYYRQRNRISVFSFILLLLLQFVLIQWGIRSIHTQFLPVVNSYIINFTFSLTLFSIVAMANIKAIGALPKRLAEISYSVYLLHGSIGIAALNFLMPYLGYSTSLVIALGIVLAISYISFRFIEKPSQKLARILIVGSQCTQPKLA